MLAELEFIPIGAPSASLSGVLAQVARLVDESGLDYRVGAMGTVVEGDWEALLGLARRCHEAVLAQTPRVLTTIRLDDRKDKAGPRMRQKVQSLESAAGRRLKQ